MAVKCGGQRNSLRRWLLLSALFFVLLALGAGGWMFWKLEPSHHFEQAKHPVLVQPSEPPDESKHQENKAAFNVLILGTDSRNEEFSRTDVIMVARVNPRDKTVNLLSIPRDLRVHIPDIGYTKINHAHILGEMRGGNREGTKAALQAVSDFLGISVNYYVKTDFQGFKNFIDTIGGVDVELPESVELPDLNTTVPAGRQHLNGEMALEVVRERYSRPNGEFGRQADQAQVLKAVAQKLLQPESLPKLPGLLEQVRQDIVDTNFSDSDLLSLAWLFKGMTGKQVNYMQIPGRGETLFDPLAGDRLYYWIADPEAVTSVRQNFHKNNEFPEGTDSMPR
ncbi:LCP family protein [Effusibacillus lacus]|nr:LCP family protein [Effusibacillus lacus]TCS70810.1 LytR family transcriptional attenuator [Effusibacillus lacus]